MTRILRTYLLWLLIAAVPFQAFAASLRACASGHQGMSMFGADVTAKSGEVQKKLEPMVRQSSLVKGHCEEMKAPESPAVDNFDSFEQGSCSACAACSIGASAPPPMLTFKDSFNNAQVYSTSSVTLVASFIPDSLKRPPRLTLI
jgi:hypothetical protein